jgi:hypothetical protein
MSLANLHLCSGANALVQQLGHDLAGTVPCRADPKNTQLSPEPFNAAVVGPRTGLSDPNLEPSGPMTDSQEQEAGKRELL